MRLVSLSWAEFCHELANQFSMGDRTLGAKYQLRNLKFTPNTDFHEYVTKLRNCFLNIPALTDEQKVDHLESALPPDMLTFLRTHRVPGVGFETLIIMLAHQANILKST